MPLQFPRNQPQPGDRGVPEIYPQAFEQVPRLVLEEDGGAGVAFERQHRALRTIGKPQRFGDARDVRAHDLPPAQYEGCVEEAGTLECGRCVAESVLAGMAGAPPPRGARTVRLGASFVGSLHLTRQQ